MVRVRPRAYRDYERFITTANVTTTLHPIRIKTYTLPWWLYLLVVLIALIILALITIALWKVSAFVMTEQLFSTRIFWDISEGKEKTKN